MKDGKFCAATSYSLIVPDPYGDPGSIYTSTLLATSPGVSSIHIYNENSYWLTFMKKISDYWTSPWKQVYVITIPYNADHYFYEYSAVPAQGYQLTMRTRLATYNTSNTFTSFVALVGMFLHFWHFDTCHPISIFNAVLLTLTSVIRLSLCFRHLQSSIGSVQLIQLDYQVHDPSTKSNYRPLRRSIHSI